MTMTEMDRPQIEMDLMQAAGDALALCPSFTMQPRNIKFALCSIIWTMGGKDKMARFKGLIGAIEDEDYATAATAADKLLSAANVSNSRAIVDMIRGCAR